eukprot:1160533-Pelagomonas_calceolata.AAC.10
MDRELNPGQQQALEQAWEESKIQGRRTQPKYRLAHEVLQRVELFAQVRTGSMFSGVAKGFKAFLDGDDEQLIPPQDLILQAWPHDACPACSSMLAVPPHETTHEIVHSKHDAYTHPQEAFSVVIRRYAPPSGRLSNGSSTADDMHSVDLGGGSPKRTPSPLIPASPLDAYHSQQHPLPQTKPMQPPLTSTQPVQQQQQQHPTHHQAPQRPQEGGEAAAAPAATHQQKPQSQHQQNALFSRFNNATSMLQKMATHVVGGEEADVAAKFKSQLDKLKQELVDCTQAQLMFFNALASAMYAEPSFRKGAFGQVSQAMYENEE